MSAGWLVLITIQDQVNHMARPVFNMSQCTYFMLAGWWSGQEVGCWLCVVRKTGGVCVSPYPQRGSPHDGQVLEANARSMHTNRNGEGTGGRDRSVTEDCSCFISLDWRSTATDNLCFTHVPWPKNGKPKKRQEGVTESHFGAFVNKGMIVNWIICTNDDTRSSQSHGLARV